MPDTAEPRNTLDDQLPLVYEELRRLAASYLRRERTDHTLQPTSSSTRPTSACWSSARPAGRTAPSSSGWRRP